MIQPELLDGEFMRQYEHMHQVHAITHCREAADDLIHLALMIVDRLEEHHW